MAGKDRGQTSNLKQQLLEKGDLFSFIQAFRLLIYLTEKETGLRRKKELSHRIRVRPDLSLAFPESDITLIEECPLKDEGEPPSFLITATFLGLYGTSSPLPTFYTEELFDEQSKDRSITRDFLDVLNAPLFHLYFKIWSKYRLFYKVVEQKDSETLERLYCLLGLEERELQKQTADSFSLLRYLGLISQFPRSAEGLRCMLADRLGEPNLEIEQCVPRIAMIPQDQRGYLGKSCNILGRDSYLGMQVIDRTGKFLICAGPLESERFQCLLPDQPSFQDLARLVRFYLNQPFVWGLQLVVEKDEIKPVVLGEKRWSQLGWNSWIFSPGFTPVNTSVELEIPPESMN